MRLEETQRNVDIARQSDDLVAPRDIELTWIVCVGSHRPVRLSSDHGYRGLGAFMPVGTVPQRSPHADCPATPLEAIACGHEVLQPFARMEGNSRAASLHFEGTVFTTDPACRAIRWIEPPVTEIGAQIGAGWHNAG
jgi:hypothetical protein